MSIDPARVKALFQAAIELADPADRAAFIDREIGDDVGLRARLDALLAAFDHPPEALDRPLAADTAPTTDGAELRPAEGQTVGYVPKSSSSGTILGSLVAGRYKIRQEIGEGGMGSVYLAEQLQPVKRMVAVKLIKAGMDSRTVLARFESERQALALMDHPNIAKVLDAGTTGDGRPFFVMELVKGVPLTDYCDQHRLGLPERLALFRQICSAVQHAHQKGIIHRDLKPTNILVESHDDKPVPKVIDFGLAKATSGVQLSEHSLYSAFGTVAGTPLYMAPEQATFNAIDIDTRADIYALGVILYELLTGSTPIQRDTFKRAALDEMMRMIREVEPPTPSSRLSNSDTLPNIAANRHSEPVRLSRFVRGDLDWIVMKALAKERQRRYDSPIALAQDIERFTNHEPVSAGPPSSTYRLRKFVRRNRVQVVAAGLVFLAMTAGVVGTTLGLFEATKQRNEAQKQEKIARNEAEAKEKARKAEAEQREEAEKRLVWVQKSNQILGSVFINLHPRAEMRADRPLLERLGESLDRASAQLEGEAIGDPLTVARMQLILGESLLNLGYAEKAVALCTKARATFTSKLGPDHPDTLTSMNDLASGYQAVGKLDLALPLLEETLAMRKAKLGAGHPDTLTSLGNLAVGYQAAGRLDRALPLLEEALATCKSKLGADHPDTLASMNNLALCYMSAGKPERAIPLLEEAMVLMKAKLGPSHPDTLTSMNSLAISYKSAGKVDRAIPLLMEALALGTAKHGADHPGTLMSMGNLAVSYQAAGKLDRALPLYEKCLELRKSKLGADHPDTLATMGNLAACYLADRKLDRALPLFEESLAMKKAKLGADNPSTLASMNNLAMGYKAAGRLDRALPLLEEALALMKAKLGPDHPDTLGFMNNLASGYRAAGKPDRALPLMKERLALMKVKLPAGSPQLAALLAQTGTALLEIKAWDDAEPVLREYLAIREQAEPEGWRTFSIKSMLGGALLGQKKYAEAEPLIRAGYEGMKAQADKIPPNARVNLVTSLDRLIELAEATNKPDQAKAWKDERAKLTNVSPSEKK